VLTFTLKIEGTLHLPKTWSPDTSPRPTCPILVQVWCFECRLTYESPALTASSRSFQTKIRSVELVWLARGGWLSSYPWSIKETSPWKLAGGQINS